MQLSPTEVRPTTRGLRGGPLLRRVFRWLFEPVQFPDEATKELAELARRGTLVYVMRSAGILNFLYFNWAFARRGLPIARAALGLSTRMFRPLAALFVPRRGVGAAWKRADAAAIVKAVAEGGAAMVFLRRPRLLDPKGRSTVDDDPFAGLVALQRLGGRPIFLVPQVLVFKRAPVRLRPGITDVVLGSAEVPGRIHAFVSFLSNRRKAFAKIGRPIDLSEVLPQEEGTPDEVIGRKVRGSLAVGLGREVRAIVGPPLKDVQRMEAEILRDRVLREELARAGAEGVQDVEEKAREALREIAARFSPGFFDGANTVARWVFHRLYEGVHVDEEGLHRAADASRRAPLVFCPTHRSHVDYLLISHVLFERGMTPPLVAAGANLAFWPLGAIFRRGGAFFIRRSFKGDRVYGAALAAYVRKIAREGYTQEFYPEGGRTRTGRILHPKYGLISMEVDAWIAGARDDLHFVPVAIDYEKLIEAAAYARELAGGEKRKETLGDLLRAPRVLRSRWGHVHVQVDEPISLARFARERGFDPHGAGPAERKALVRALAHRIAYGMGRVQTITASALAAAAMLGHRRRGITQRELEDRVELMMALARSRGRRFSSVVESTGIPAMQEAVEGFVAARQVIVAEANQELIYRVDEAARLPVSFYKNNIVHHFEEEAVLLGAVLALGGTHVSREALLPRVTQLSRLLKRELSFRPAPLEQTVSETVERLQSFGLLRANGETITIPGAARERAVFLRDLLADVIETYLAVLGALHVLEGGPLDRRELARRCLENARALYLAGRIERVEAVSRPSVDIAVGWLADEGHVTLHEDGSVDLTGLRDPAARDALVEQVTEFLRP